MNSLLISSSFLHNNETNSASRKIRHNFAGMQNRLIACALCLCLKEDITRLADERSSIYKDVLDFNEM